MRRAAEQQCNGRQHQGVEDLVPAEGPDEAEQVQGHRQKQDKKNGRNGQGNARHGALEQPEEQVQQDDRCKICSRHPEVAPGSTLDRS